MPNTRFKNPSEMPIGGVQFRQMEIGWKAPMPFSESVDVLAYRIQKLRQTNPTLLRLKLPTALEVIKQEIIDYNCALHPQQCISVGLVEHTKHHEGKVVSGGGCCGRSK